MKIKTFALALSLMFFAGITTSSVASVVNLDNQITVTRVDDDKDKKKAKAKAEDKKDCTTKKSSCCGDQKLKSDCKDKKSTPDKK